MEKPSRFLANSSTALEQLRGLINQHESTPGIPLPTERELSDTLGVGRREVHRALDVLKEEGRIWRKQGWRHLRELARTSERVDSYNDHHHNIMSAIIQCQPNEAASAMREHLLSLQTALIQAIHLAYNSTL